MVYRIYYDFILVKLIILIFLIDCAYILNMNLHHLKAFYEVARSLSFTKAAETLFLTQPAVTYAVNSLETMYDIKLFDRTHRQIELTDSGRELYTIAETIFSLAEQSDEMLSDYNEIKRGTVKVDATTTFAAYYLPEIYKRFHLKYRDINVINNTGNTKRIIENTEAGLNDIAFVAYDPGNDKLETIEFLRDRLIVIVSPDHPFTEKKYIKPGDLNGQEMVLREKGSSPRGLLDTFFELHNLRPHIVFESGSTPAIKKAVEHGSGISILSYQSVKQELINGSIARIEIADTSLVYNFYLIYRRSKYFSKRAKLFLETAMETARRYS